MNKAATCNVVEGNTAITTRQEDQFHVIPQRIRYIIKQRRTTKKLLQKTHDPKRKLDLNRLGSVVEQELDPTTRNSTAGSSSQSKPQYRNSDETKTDTEIIDRSSVQEMAT